MFFKEPAKKQRGAVLNERLRDFVRLTALIASLTGLYLALAKDTVCR